MIARLVRDARDIRYLLLAVVAWVVIARYRFLVPFALLHQFLDQIGRWGIGVLKPLVVDNAPPGEHYRDRPAASGGRR